MYGLVTLLPLCNVILKQNGFKADESQLLMIFMIGTTLGLIITSRLINKLNAMFPKIIWGLSLLGAGALYYKHQRQQFCAVQYRYRSAWAESERDHGHPADQFPKRGQQRRSNRLERPRPVGALSRRGSRGDDSDRILPEISQITSEMQFLGAFGLLVGMYGIGLVSELV